MSDSEPPVVPVGEHAAQASRSGLSKGAVMGLVAGALLVLLVVIAAIVAPRLLSSEATASASPSPSITPSPTPSASPSPSEALVYEGRNPDMSDDEALARAQAPATGEVWLAEPQEIAEPAWATDGGFWNTIDGSPQWYLVGHRGDVEILSPSTSGDLVEVGPTGQPSLIVAPYPWQAESDVPDYDYPIPVDVAIYYDSLAVPQHFAVLEGASLDIRDRTFGREPTGDASEVVGKWGGNTVLRLTRSSVGTIPRTAAVLNGIAQDVAYVVRTPYGAFFQPPFSPIEGDIAWDSGTGALAGSGFIDFWDASCGNETEYHVMIPANAVQPWRQVGTLRSGPVLASLPESQLAAAHYADWIDSTDSGYVLSAGEASIASIEDYLAAPAYIALPAEDGSGWWLLLNRELSPRSWC